MEFWLGLKNPVRTIYKYCIDPEFPILPLPRTSLLDMRRESYEY
jgi:hypothetical protein